jgi:hypothetical protein
MVFNETQQSTWGTIIASCLGWVDFIVALNVNTESGSFLTKDTIDTQISLVIEY